MGKWDVAWTVVIAGLIGLLISAVGIANKAQRELEHVKALEVMAEHQMLADSNALHELRIQLDIAREALDQKPKVVEVVKPRIVYEPCHVPAFSDDSRTRGKGQP